MNREANRYEADYERNQKRAITIELLKRQQRKLSSPIKALKVNTVRTKKMHTNMGDKLKTMTTIGLSNMVNSRNQTPESSKDLDEEELHFHHKKINDKKEARAKQ